MRGVFLLEIVPVAKIFTPFSSKFGIPRQSGLADTEGKIIFEPEFRSPEALRGMEGFSHLWLIWGFTEAKRNKNTLTVRPPRLGGNERVGVFASRSPYRPNSLGL
ncbi:MAG: SAM-dependent methyltransferase, partial [Oscillospiraceae bacterium]|nr:SAM-dependent methyltransferase [Oscillospiraceae bacterium]